MCRQYCMFLVGVDCVAMSDNSHNLLSVLNLRNPLHARSPALITESGVTWSYSDLGILSAKLAAVLSRLGVVPGDRVSAQVLKSPESLCLYFACLQVGAIYHPLNPAYSDRELAYFLEDAGPKLFVCSPDRELQSQRVGRTAKVERILTLEQNGRGSLLDHVTDETLETIAVLEGNAPAALLYSSGTTGRPKGIVLTHDNLRSNALALIDTWQFTAADVLLHTLPIFHVHGLFVACHCALISGASMLWHTSFSAPAVLSELPRATVFMGVPTYYTRLLQDPELSVSVCRSMRLFISGSAPLLATTWREFELRTGHQILERYGMTETGMTLSNPLMGERKPGSVGFPLPGIEVRIEALKDSAVTGQEAGLLMVRGRNVFKAYWGMPEKTRADFSDDGFFKTGDIASIDTEGYYSIVGRSKDMIISGGLNIYPKEIEQVLDEHPQVMESAVIGIPDPDYGEQVIAVIVPASPVDDESSLIESLAALCAGELAGFKRPKRFRLVNELPRNAMGKVQKTELRKQQLEMLT